MSTPAETGRPTRVAIVGCGIIGKHHATVISRHPAFVVTGLVDPLPEAVEGARRVLADAGAPEPVVYDSIAAACDSGEVDLAVLCTPSGMHTEQATEVLDHGRHVVIEKPLDVTAERGRVFAERARAATENGQLVSVISQHRFDPANAAIAAGAHGGGFGTLTSALASMAWYRSQGYYDQGDWRGTWAWDGGGAVMNQCVHTVDLLRWFLGRPEEISAFTGRLAHERIEVEDTAVAVIRFEGGALATLHATTAAFPGLRTRIQVHGTQGSAIVDEDRLEYFFAAPDADEFGTHGFSAHSGVKVENQAAEQVPVEQLASSPKPAENFIEGHYRQYDDLADALATGRAPGVTVDEALLSLALVRSLYVSATLGQPVRFEDVLAGKHDDVMAEKGGVA
ncbi:putative dehydrogenase [Friedmanniella endophytica]|uniref:Putative dehydrogenase n=1 Tax=Microlunatus kandeliicorticis TaxID=1759536 RepID=A0A7W3ITA1_9ACTN|nr:Gfo/Idh/MocA family oxidoreductase [Microlunatus kandeliicorticis]MBA8794810.1 putative dehydrogenase [Microlunatus kandeliicorticis]